MPYQESQLVVCYIGPVLLWICVNDYCATHWSALPILTRQRGAGTKFYKPDKEGQGQSFTNQTKRGGGKVLQTRQRGSWTKFY